MIKKILLSIISLINRLYPKSTKRILFISSPDLTDNSFALFKYLIENNSKDYLFAWLIDEPKNLKLYRKMIQENILITENKLNQIKFVSKKSLSGFFTYIRSKYIFFTHGFYTGMQVPKNQMRINLWHGMPLKAIGYINKHGDNRTIPQCSVVFATSDIFQNIMSKVFGLSKKQVLITGQPRCDLLREGGDSLQKLGIQKKLYQTIIFWAPTYRYSKDNKIKDGIFNHTLPLLQDGELEKFNSYLSSINTYMIVKLHPMDILNVYDFKSLTYITILKDEIFLKKSCQLYSLLSEIDILLTDFSSIYIDFLLLDKPIVFGIDDFEAYSKTRDFVFTEPIKYMPGPIVNNMESLVAILDSIIVNKQDTYVKQRKEIKRLFHTYENTFSKRLLENLGIL